MSSSHIVDGTAQHFPVMNREFTREECIKRLLDYSNTNIEKREN